MIDGPKRFFEMRGAVFSNFQQAVGKCDSAFPTGAFQALTNRLRDCFRHAFSRKLGQLVRESVRFFVLDVEAHKGTILPSFSTLLPLQRQGEGSPLIYGPILSWLLLDRGQSAAQSGGFS